MLNNEKKFFPLGFTLAEVLIVLMIIGLIAAFTIPVLVKNLQDMQYKAAWKKEFSVLSQAMLLASGDNSGSIKGLLIAYELNNFRDIFTPYLRVSKTCLAEHTAGICWHINDGTAWFDELGNGAAYNWMDYWAGMILQDGTIIAIAQGSETCTDDAGGTLGNIQCGIMYIDVNGFKRPNTIGRDIYAVHVTENRIIPYGANDGYEQHCGTAWSSGLGCSAKYLYN